MEQTIKTIDLKVNWNWKLMPISNDLTKISVLHSTKLRLRTSVRHLLVLQLKNARIGPSPNHYVHASTIFLQCKRSPTATHATYPVGRRNNVRSPAYLPRWRTRALAWKAVIKHSRPYRHIERSIIFIVLFWFLFSVFFSIEVISIK